MDLVISKLEYDQRIQPSLPDNRLLDYLGEDGIRKMVNDHYELLIRSNIKDMFPTEPEKLELAKTKAADFFIQRLGGRTYYNERYGNPMLSKRHSPFRITPSVRIIWLDCYRQVLSKLEVPENVIQSFWNFLDQFSNWMVNTVDSILYKKQDS